MTVSLKVVVIGGTGLIGSKVVANLTELGHDAIAASPLSGVNTLTGEGLAEALAGAQVVVDVSNSPSFADDDVMHFFTTSTGNLLAAERVAGVGHHVALSVVGADRNPNSGVPVFGIALSPDGSRLAVPDADNAIQLWNTGTTEQTGVTLRGHTDLVLSLAFSADGQHLVSGGVARFHSHGALLRLWTASIPTPTLPA
jgi:WD40 repeat protein